MSKVNRRKEIKEKEAFQLKFQLALSQTNKAVSNWLLPNATKSENIGKQGFLDLPIVPSGAGLYELEKNGENATVGDFLQNGTAIPKNIKQDPKANSSKAMTALMNKMRTDTRKNLASSSKVFKGKLKILEGMKKPQIKAKQVDSDSEEESKFNRHGKKGSGLHFDKRKKRPF